MTRWRPTIKGFCSALGDENVYVSITPLGMAVLSDGEEAQAATRGSAAIGTREMLSPLAGPDPSRHPALTNRQSEILEAIRVYYRAHGIPPSVRTLCRVFGLRSTGTISPQLKQLFLKGRLRREGRFYVPIPLGNGPKDSLGE